MEKNSYETLDKYIPDLKLSRKRVKATKEKRKCSDKILVICNQFKAFYFCLNAFYEKLFNDCMLRMCPDYPFTIEKYSECMEEGGCWVVQYCETDTDGAIENLGIMNKQGQKMMFCRCKPLKEIDGEIVKRKYLNHVSEFEPCKYMCKNIRTYGNCLFEEEIMFKTKKTIKYKPLDFYLNLNRS